MSLKKAIDTQQLEGNCKLGPPEPGVLFITQRFDWLEAGSPVGRI